jgi:hypothetical protein
MSTVSMLLRMVLSLDVDPVLVNLSRCCHLICENSHIHPLDLPPVLPTSAVSLPLKEEVEEVDRNKREGHIQPLVVVLVPMVAITMTMATATVKPDAVPSQGLNEPGVNNLQVQTSVLLMSCKMVDEEVPSLIVA